MLRNTLSFQGEPWILRLKRKELIVCLRDGVTLPALLEAAVRGRPAGARGKEKLLEPTPARFFDSGHLREGP